MSDDHASTYLFRHPPSPALTRREWVASQTAAVVVATRLSRSRRGTRVSSRTAARIARQATRLVPDRWLTLAQHAVDTAQRAGAQYADARLTRTVQQWYSFRESGSLTKDFELVGIGVRALVNGYWGFAACPSGGVAAVERLAQDAVAQAQANASGPRRVVDLGHVPVATGTWMTPVGIDPFAISIEEKGDYLEYWRETAKRLGILIDALGSFLHCARQERVVATSDGAGFTQTCYESDAKISCQSEEFGQLTIELPGLEATGQGWELFLDAKIPDLLAMVPAQLKAKAQLIANSKPSTVGRYTLVCDGATMAAVLDHTMGVATQLDRALGYEANAGGTSFLDDPLAILGKLPIASSPVTVTANRSAPTQLATVRWDDEGVEPEPFTLIRDGVLTDFQTTREQAAWLAPVYAQQGQPVHSHGCAAAEDALAITMQHMPNLALTPSAEAVRLQDLVADVQKGILVTEGTVLQVDAQARTGVLIGTMREITNGRMGRLLQGGAVQFDTPDLWKHIIAVGGATTTGRTTASQYGSDVMVNKMMGRIGKGQPLQVTSHTVTAAAAMIINQAVIDPERKA